MLRYCLLILLFLTGCASLPGSVTEKFDSGKIEYVLTKHDTATVVFENGLGGRLDWWAKVYPAIAETTTAFAYNRPGYGRSDFPNTPRDGLHVVEELRALLLEKDLHPPYILVGHSLGGLYMQFFARRFPDEVSALILVDSTHPLHFKDKGAPEHWPGWLHFLFYLWMSDIEKEEFEAIDTTGESILTLPSFTGKPVIVLSAKKPMEEKSELADYANMLRADLANLYPGSTQVWVESGHGIPLEKPEAVIDAIKEVQNSVRHPQ